MWLFLLRSEKQGRWNTCAVAQLNSKAFFSPVLLWLVFFLCFCGSAAVWPTPWLVPAAAVWWCKCSTIPATVPNLFKHSTVIVNPPLVTLVCLYQLFILPKRSDLPMSLFCYSRTLSVRSGTIRQSVCMVNICPSMSPFQFCSYQFLWMWLLVVYHCATILSLCTLPYKTVFFPFSPLTSYLNFFFSCVPGVCSFKNTERIQDSEPAE